jgi:hypothetical protein
MSRWCPPDGIDKWSKHLLIVPPDGIVEDSITLSEGAIKVSFVPFNGVSLLFLIFKLLEFSPRYIGLNPFF